MNNLVFRKNNMSTKRFIAFDIEDSNENIFQENEVLLSGDESTAFKVRGSHKNQFIGNKVLITEQIELINKLKQDVSSFQNQSNSELEGNLEKISLKIKELEEANTSNVLERANNLSQTILNVIELFGEKIPSVATKLSPYLLSIPSLF